MFETEICGLFLVWKLTWGAMARLQPSPPSGYAPVLSLLASVQLASYYTYYIIRGANHDFKNVGER